MRRKAPPPSGRGALVFFGCVERLQQNVVGA
jgi:hypothetical protein